MDELDAGRQPDMPVAAIAAQRGGAKGEHRAEPLSAGGDQMSGQLRDQVHRALHMLQDRRIDPVEIRADQPQQRFQRRFRSGAVLLEVYDRGQSPTPFTLTIPRAAE